jgi:hypothetical protein
VRYELLYSARDAKAFEDIERSLAALREVAITAAVQRAAISAMRGLAPLGRHRAPLPDLLIAEAAQKHGLTVLHQDRHFEQLQQVMAFGAHRPVPDSAIGANERLGLRSLSSPLAVSVWRHSDQFEARFRVGGPS